MMRALILSICLLGACGPTITLTDDVDLTWDWGPTLTRFDDSLHGPYVRGTKLRLYVSSSDDKQDFSGWSIASTDPGIVKIDTTTSDDLGLAASAQAVGEGSTDIVVLDAHGKVVGRGDAVVAMPDRVTLDAHGYLIIGRDAEAPVDEARLLEGGEATFLVKYFLGTQELHGNGVLTTGAADGIVTQERTSWLFEDREWLSITSTQQGLNQLPLIVDGTPVSNAQVITVGEAAIDGMALISQSEDNAKDGDWFVALAQSYDRDGRRIFGVDYDWDIDGTQLDAQGDLYRYEFHSGEWRMVTAQRAGHQDSLMIQSDKGFVDSSNHIGCSASGGAASPLWVLGALLLVVRRRHRALRPLGGR